MNKETYNIIDRFTGDIRFTAEIECAAKHTPGPYLAHTDGRTWWVQTPAPERRVVATGLDEPHARLIAAAPELFDVVKSLRDYIADTASGALHYSDSGEGVKAMATEDLARVDAAIAKALSLLERGEGPVADLAAAHTRAAVERERASCEAIVRNLEDGAVRERDSLMDARGRGYSVSAGDVDQWAKLVVHYRTIANAIAARKAQQ
jgi:hypothetical protein